MQSANPTCSSDLRQSTFATNAASCVAAGIVAIVTTVITTGGPALSVSPKFTDLIDSHGFSLRSFIVSPKLKKLSVLVFYYSKLLAVDLIRQIQQFMVPPFEFISSTVEVQKFCQMRSLLQQDLSSTVEVQKFCRMRRFLPQDLQTQRQLMLLIDATHDTPQYSSSRASTVSNHSRRLLLSRVGVKSQMPDNWSETIRFWVIMRLLSDLADQYLGCISSNGQLDILRIDRSLDCVPMEVIHRIVSASQGEGDCPWTPRLGLVSLSWLIPSNDLLSSLIQKGPQKNNRLIELLDDGQPILPYGNPTIFHTFACYLKLKLASEDTFVQFKSIFRPFRPSVIDKRDNIYKINTNPEEIWFNKYLLDSTSSSLKEDLSPLIGPWLVITIIIYKLTKFKQSLLDVGCALEEGIDRLMACGSESKGSESRSPVNGISVSSGSVENNRPMSTRSNEQKDWEKREAQHQFIKRSMGIPSSVTADPVANTVSDGFKCVIS